MSIPTPTSALLDGRATDGGRAMQRAFVWLTGSFAAAGGIVALTALVATGSEREAGRMTVAAQNGAGYVETVASGYAANQARHYRY